MYQNITVVGLGTIGGFLSKNLSELETTKSLGLVDYDIVNNSNLKNSIYKKSDVGKFKVDCISSIVQNLNSDLKITKINDRYLEGKTKLPKNNLVIDCRDFTYDRGSEIDVRLYISSRYLVIDGQKNTIYRKHHEGKYIDNLTKSDVNSATFNMAWLISNGMIKEIIEKSLVHKIEFDYLKKIVYETVHDHDNKLEVIMDHHKGNENLINFYENAERILELNKKFDLNLCLGNRKSPLACRTIPKNNLMDINDLSKSILNMTKSSYSYNNYIVAPVLENKMCYVVLIPETGAA